MPQIEAMLKAKVPIVSTTEELAYPGYTHVRQARQIDALAKKAKVAVLGTGVNPGFVMDALPIALTAVCERVDRVTVQRIQDARNRRLPFQQKIGAGLTTEQFQKQVDEGSVRHVGFTESIAMIADALGWTLDRITDDVRAEARAGDDLERVPRRRSRLRVRHRSGRRRLPEEGAGDPPAHGGVPRRARVVRRDRDRRHAAAVGEDRRRHPRRRRDGGASSSTRSRRCSTPRPACTRCAICRCRRSLPGLTGIWYGSSDSPVIPHWQITVTDSRCRRAVPMRAGCRSTPPTRRTPSSAAAAAATFR